MSSKFRVWAPSAAEVCISVAGDIRRTTREERGFFSMEKLPDGVDYFVRIDGRDLPDPRSRCQPQGINGPSRSLSDHFDWDDHQFRAAPLSAALIYELHVGTFTPSGTFESAIARLDHLVSLGVTHVELMPLATFPGRWGWGYDGVALFAPHAAYGTPDDLKRFVAQCHARGLAVLIDVVYNHLGPDGNHLDAFGPYFTTRYQTPWGAAVNLDDRGSDEVRRFFIDNACMWLEDYHFDGLRLDAVHTLYDQGARHWLEELSAAVHALQSKLGKPLCVIAESDQNDSYLTTPSELGGLGMDAQWSDDFQHALHAVLTNETNGCNTDFGQLAHVGSALTQGFVYVGQYSVFRDRRHGRGLGDASGHRLIGFLQNHDQVGNRPAGERISQLISPGLLRIGASLVFIAPFVPMLFQGEEWGASTPFLYFTDHQNPEIAEAVRKGRREEFRGFGLDPSDVPDPQSEASYRASQLNWTEIEHAPHAELLDFYRSLARLRKSQPDLLDGRRDRVQVSYDETARWLQVRRGAVTLLANLSSDRRELPRPLGTLALSYPSPAVAGAQEGTILLDQESCYIFVEALADAEPAKESAL